MTASKKKLNKIIKDQQNPAYPYTPYEAINLQTGNHLSEITNGSPVYVVTKIGEYETYFSDFINENKIISIAYTKDAYLNTCKTRNSTRKKEDNVYMNSELKTIEKGHDIGNPPFQKGKDKQFYIKIIRSSLSRTAENHINSKICPKTFLRSKLFKEMQKDYDFIKICIDKPGDFFEKVSSSFMYFIARKRTGNKENGSQCHFVSRNADKIIDLRKINFYLDNEENFIHKDKLEILDKLYIKKIKSFSGSGDTELTQNKTTFSFEKTTNKAYSVYLSSDPQKREMFSKNPAPGYGEEKLCISSILVPGESNYYTEFNKNKGVGRYSVYFKVNKKESEILKDFFDSEIYIFINHFKRTGRYAFLKEIPYLDFENKSIKNRNFYKYFKEQNIINDTDIKTIKNFVSSLDKIKTG